MSASIAAPSGMAVGAGGASAPQVVAGSADPVGAFLEGLCSLLDAADPTAWEHLHAERVRELLGRLNRVVARIGAHQVAAARALDASGLARRKGRTSTGQLLAGDFGGDRAAGAALVRTATTLEQAEAGLTEQAMAAGRLTIAQAGVIARALAALPEDITTAERSRCERRLIADAARMTLRDLRRRADRILSLVRPEPVVDLHEEDLVKARERAAWGRTELSMGDNGDGTWWGRVHAARSPGADAQDPGRCGRCAPPGTPGWCPIRQHRDQVWLRGHRDELWFRGHRAGVWFRRHGADLRVRLLVCREARGPAGQRRLG